MTAGLQAASMALDYVRTTQGASSLSHLTALQRLAPADALVLDETAVRTLELFEGADGSVRSSLLGVLDATVTPMGARLLRQWLLRPLRDPAAIAARQEGVAALVDDPATRAALRRGLGRDRRPGAAHQPRHPGHGPRAGPGRPARVAPGASRPARSRVRAGRAAPRRGRRRRSTRSTRCARCWPRPWSTSPRSPSATAASSARAGARRCAPSWRTRARRATGSPASRSASARARGIAGLRVRFNRVFGYGIEVARAHVRTGAARVRSPPDLDHGRALRDRGAEGARGHRAGRRRAPPAAGVRAVRGRAPPGGGARARPPGHGAGRGRARRLRGPRGGGPSARARAPGGGRERRPRHRRWPPPGARGARRAGRSRPTMSPSTPRPAS